MYDPFHKSWCCQFLLLVFRPSHFMYSTSAALSIVTITNGNFRQDIVILLTCSVIQMSIIEPLKTFKNSPYPISILHSGRKFHDQFGCSSQKHGWQRFHLFPSTFIWVLMLPRQSVSVLSPLKGHYYYLYLRFLPWVSQCPLEKNPHFRCL